MKVDTSIIGFLIRTLILLIVSSYLGYLYGLDKLPLLDLFNFWLFVGIFQLFIFVLIETFAWTKKQKEML